MSRSNYSDDCDNLQLYRQSVENAINGKRGQTFLRDFVKALDEMPVKRLITQELITETGEVCAIGAVCKARGIDVSHVDVEDRDSVGQLVGIAPSMAAEIEYENDEVSSRETPEERWKRMRDWALENINVEKV